MMASFQEGYTDKKAHRTALGKMPEPDLSFDHAVPRHSSLG
jgi:hypothetical protein